MTIKKIIITMFLLSIATTAGCLSKESVSGTPTTESLQATPVPVAGAGAAIGAANSAAASPGSATPTPIGKETIKIPDDAIMVGTSGNEFHKFKRSEFMENFCLQSRHTCFVNVKITSTTISGTMVNTDPSLWGETARFSIHFWKENKSSETGIVSEGFNDMPTTAGEQNRNFRSEIRPEVQSREWVSLEIW